jgi:hypothetical protein
MSNPTTAPKPPSEHNRPTVLLVGGGTHATATLPQGVREFQARGWNVHVGVTHAGMAFVNAAGIADELRELTGEQILLGYNHPLQADEPAPSDRSDIDMTKVKAISAITTVDMLSKLKDGTQDQDIVLGLILEAQGDIPILLVPYSNKKHMSIAQMRDPRHGAIPRLRGIGYEFVELDLHAPRAPEKAVVPWPVIAERTIKAAERMGLVPPRGEMDVPEPPPGRPPGPMRQARVERSQQPDLGIKPPGGDGPELPPLPPNPLLPGS